MARDTKLPTDADAAPDAAADATLIAARYELAELIGRGSMGSVYRAKDVVLDRPVAVKVFPAEAGDADQAARYEQEARLLGGLSHPSLVTVFDAGIDAAIAEGAKPYLVMELALGQVLSDRLRSGPLDVAETVALAGQLSSALAYVHRRGIIHRDIKPANILLAPADELDDGGVAKLADFGIARLVDGTRITMTGFTVGTANYLSPEQLSGKPVSSPCDIYSLGLVLLECLTGEVAFPGSGAEAALPRLHGPPPIPDSLPEGWARLLRAMTDPDPDLRPTAAEVGVAVAGLAGEQPATPGPEAAPPAEAATQVVRSENIAAAAPVELPPTDAVPLAEVAPAAEAPPGPLDVPLGDHTPLDATRVLPVVDAPAGRVRGTRQTPRRWGWLAAAAALVVLVFIVVFVVSSGGSDSKGPATPTYPTVPGQLGDHLRKLQQDVP